MSEGDARLRSKHRATDLTGEAKGEPVFLGTYRRG